LRNSDCSARAVVGDQLRKDGSSYCADLRHLDTCVRRAHPCPSCAGWKMTTLALGMAFTDDGTWQFRSRLLARRSLLKSSGYNLDGRRWLSIPVRMHAWCIDACRYIHSGAAGSAIRAVRQRDLWGGRDSVTTLASQMEESFSDSCSLLCRWR
jgi:hypothetical protein